MQPKKKSCMNTGNCVSPEFHVIEIQQAQVNFTEK